MELMIGTALIVVLVHSVVGIVDLVIGWQTLTRPIVLAPIIGLVLGDFQTGIILGASLEAIFMGISAIGGVMPANPASAATIVTTFVITTGADIETGMALAMPIGMLMMLPGAYFMPLSSAFAPLYERLARNNKRKLYGILHVVNMPVLMSIPGGIIMFSLLAFGMGLADNLMALAPDWLMAGLGASGSMMMAVGFAMITNMIWSKETGVFFFIGFVLAMFLGLETIPLAIIGVSAAILIFFRDKHTYDQLKTATVANKNEEEDFFS